MTPKVSRLFLNIYIYVYSPVDELEDSEDGEECEGPVDDSEVKEEENLETNILGTGA